MKKTFFALFFLLTLTSSIFADSISATISEIKSKPSFYNGKEICVSGFFSIWKNAPGAPPVSRSDWVL